MIKHISILLIVLCFTSISCKKKCCDVNNPDCENYDPCYNKKTVNSRFKVFQANGGFPTPKWCDNIPSCDTLNNSTAIFVAPEGNTENCTYEWQLGTDPTLRYGKRVVVDFQDYLGSGTWDKFIDVNLTIRRPNDECLINKKDTVVKVSRTIFFTQGFIYLTPNTDSSSTFKGYFTDNPNKEIVLHYFKTKKFRDLILSPNSTEYFYLVKGYPFADTTFVQNNCGIPEACANYKFSRTLYNQPSCKYTNGLYYMEIYFYTYNKVRILRQNKDANGRISEYNFIGERI